MLRQLAVAEIAGNQNHAYNSDRETTAGHRLIAGNSDQHQPCFLRAFAEDRNDYSANRGLLERTGVLERKRLLVDAHPRSRPRDGGSIAICRGSVLPAVQQIARVDRS